MDKYLNEEFELLLSEGVRDKSIFKAVFLAGGPGSGKDYVMKNTLNGHGLTEISSDKAHEYLTHKDILKPDNTNQDRIKSQKELRQLLAIQGRNGLIVNGTHDDHHHTKKIKKHLEDLGYETSMVHVHADDEVSRKRNVERGKKGGRTVSEKARKEKWDAVQESRRHHAANFGGNYHEFDNSQDLRNAPPELVKQKKDELLELRDHIHNFVNTPSESEKAQKWIENAVKNDSTPVPRKGADKLPHPESIASQQAAEAGLSYYGSGRYGKGGKVTHHSINDNLTEIEKEEPKAKAKPKKLSELFADKVNSVIANEIIIEDKVIVAEKKLLSDFRRGFSESIDQGIESGLSMATSGENLARPSGENQKEEPKKKGITFSSFKAKRSI